MNIRKFIILTGIGLLLLSACNTSKVLKPEERLLPQTKFKLKVNKALKTN